MGKIGIRAELVDQIGKFILNTKQGLVPKLDGFSRVGTPNPFDNSQRLIEKTRSDAQRMLTKMINKCMAKTLTNNYKIMHPKVKNYEFATSVRIFFPKIPGRVYRNARDYAGDSAQHNS